MKKFGMTALHRTLSLLLAMLLCLLSFCSCAASGKTLMSIDGTTLSLNTYELLLSRMKGTLAYNGYEVESEDFWDYIWSTGGATYNDYFSAEILTAAKEMLVRLYLFEEVYDLTLPQSQIDEVDVYMQDILDNDFDGSKTAFNNAVSEFGVNMNMLRENYIIEEKLEYLASYISSRTADNAREEYFMEHYLCFRQILFPLYEYLYETDENGDTVYYKTGTNYIAYDKKNGKTMTMTDGSLRVDENGDVMYFNEDGSIAYDTKDGEAKGLDKDKDGYVDTQKLSADEIKNVTTNAENMRDSIEAGDFTVFEAFGEDYGDDDIWKSYPNGIFLSDEKGYSLQYLNELAIELSEAEVGDVILFESDNAFHLVMKYPLAAGAWNVEANADWFGTFDDEVVESIVAKLCEEYMDQIVVDESVLAKASDMKNIGANWNY